MAVAKITKGGQISVPAEVRRRWGTQRVIVKDHGDHLVVRPLPDDPIAAVRGALKGKLKVSTDELRRIAREEEQEIEDRKLREIYGIDPARRVPPRRDTR